jgi:hypothetical protein
MVLGRYATEWKRANARRELERAGDTRSFSHSFDPLRDPAHPFVLHGEFAVGADVPVPDGGWPLDLGPQDVHGSDEAA